DESDRSFLELSPEVAVLTNVELDHHSTYGSAFELEQAFRSFLGQLEPKGTVVAWDRPELRRLVPHDRTLITYDVEPSELPVLAAKQKPELFARNLQPDGLGTRFELVRSGAPVCEVVLPVPGRHNVLNALAALGACATASCDLEQAAQS